MTASKKIVLARKMCYLETLGESLISVTQIEISFLKPIFVGLYIEVEMLSDMGDICKIFEKDG